LEKSRDKRYANVAELALALAPFGPKRAADAAERTLRITRAAAAKVWPSVRSTTVRHPRKVMAGVLAVAAAVVTLATRSCGAPEARQLGGAVDSVGAERGLERGQ